ncbi:hypothetical protein OQJ26_03800 [Legionella sp. PATHC038]|nr:hypothetical protein [Legionella sp. PATHC038]MCW8397913.1 hypothetical protein [Legionella sp. PATHC038]
MFHYCHGQYSLEKIKITASRAAEFVLTGDKARLDGLKRVVLSLN